MASLRPGGFDDYSDEDDPYMNGHDYYDDDDDHDLPCEPIVSSVKASTVTNSGGNFGAFGPNISTNTAQSNGNTWPASAQPFNKPKRPRDTIIKPGAKNNIQDEKDVILAVDDLKVAAMQNKVDVINSCVKQGFEVDMMFPSGWTALMYAVNTANPEAVDALLKLGADANFHKDMYSVLISACSSRSDSEADVLKCVQLLLQEGADVNCFDRYHMSPIIYAAKEGRTSVIKELVKNKADINKQDTRGYSGLIWAVQLGNLRVVHTLIELGADVGKQTSDGSRAMDFAIMNGRTQIQELLKTCSDSSKQKLILTEEDLVEVERKQKSENNTNQNTVTYGDLELFLSGLELGNFIILFKDHHVKFSDLLRMTDKDLQKIGVMQFGVRKKLLDAIRQTHKKDWETTSVPSVTYNKQISCAEGIAIVQNIKKHVSYIASTIGYVGDQIKADKKILVNAQEGVGAEQLILHTDEAITNTRLLFGDLASLRSHLAEVKDEKDYRPPDLIMPKNTEKSYSKRSSINKMRCVKLTLGVTLIGIFYFKRNLLISNVINVADNLKSWSKG